MYYFPPEIESVISDKDFEKGILESNKFYEIKCSEEDDEDAECTLELIEEYSGKVPSKKWLDSHKVFLFGIRVTYVIKPSNYYFMSLYWEVHLIF